MANTPIPLADFLDLVDTVSVHQRALHGHLEDGFLALAREGYRNSASSIRIANVAPAKADSFVTSEGELVMTKSGSSLAPVPSSELRCAIDAFRDALAEAVRLVQARKNVSEINDADIIVALDAEATDKSRPVPPNDVDDEEEDDKEQEVEVDEIQAEEAEWTLVR